MTNSDRPGKVHPKIAAAIAQAAAHPGHSQTLELPVVILTKKPPPAELPGLAHTMVTTPKGATVLGSAIAALPDEPDAAGDVYRSYVTLQLPARQADEIVRGLTGVAGVVGIEPAPGLIPDLAYSIPEVQARRLDPDGTADVTHDGSGVIVGIVDFGFDFAHKNFRDAAGNSRTLAIWDQNDVDGPTAYAPPDAYKPDQTTSPKWFGEGTAGTMYQTSCVFLLSDTVRTGGGFGQNPNPYLNDKVGLSDPYEGYYDPHKNYYLQTDESEQQWISAHGTHVADIAVGNGRAFDPVGEVGHQHGVAPKADIVFVQVRKPTNPDWGVNFAHVLNAVHFIFTLANKLKKPAVVNLSMNYYSGPHDGSGPYTMTLDNMVRDQVVMGEPLLPRLLVVSAGNAYRLGRHARMVMRNRTAENIRWTMRGSDKTENLVSVWFACTSAATDKMTITLEGDDLTMVSQAGNGAGAVDIMRGSAVIGRIEDRAQLTGKRAIRVRINPKVNKKKKNIRIDISLTWDANPVKRAHMWIERDDLLDEGKWQSRFAPAGRTEAERKNDDRQSLGDLACGANVIAVGAFYGPTDQGPDQPPPERPLLDVSSCGPPVEYTSLDDSNNDTAGFGSNQPFVSAPGVLIRAARSKGGKPVDAPIYPLSVVMSGTSMAAPHGSGVVALLLQKNAGFGSPRSWSVVRQALKDGVFPSLGAYDERRGFGRLNAKLALSNLV